MSSPRSAQKVTGRRPLRQKKHEDDFIDEDSTPSNSDHDEPDRSQSLYPDLSDNLSPINQRKSKRRRSNSSRSYELDKNDSVHSETSNSAKSAGHQPSPTSKDSLYPKLAKCHNKPDSHNLWYIAATFLAVIFIAWLASSYQKKTPSSSDIKERVFANFKSFIKDFDQTKDLLIQVHAQLSDMVDEVPLQPSILFVVVPPESQETASCLVHKITDAVKSGFDDYEVPIFNVKDHVEDDVDEIKHHLEDTLSRLSYSHSAIVDHLELLNPKASNILHAFCDNENAHHKQALIMFVFAVPDSYDVCASLGVEEYVQSQLYSLWSEMKLERIAAIHTRIANAPILVKPANPDSLTKHC